MMLGIPIVGVEAISVSTKLEIRSALCPIRNARVWVTHSVPRWQRRCDRRRCDDHEPRSGICTCIARAFSTECILLGRP